MESRSTNPAVPLVGKPKKGYLRHILIKLQMSQIKSYESIKGKESDKGTPIKLLVDFSTETCQSRSQLDDTFKILKESLLFPLIHQGSYGWLLPPALSFLLNCMLKMIAF